MEKQEEMKTIKVTKKLWRRLMLWKVDLDASSIEEVLDRILKITPASQLNKLKEVKK